jgi:hypothetical protein
LKWFLSESAFNKQAQQIENTFKSVLAIQNTFEIYLLGLFMQNTFVFWHTPNNCHASVPYVPYCYANNSKTKFDLHPHRPSAAPSATAGAMLAPPSPLPWLPRCRHHCHLRHCRCHCHGCRHLRRHQHCSAAIATAFWLIVVCPSLPLLRPPLPAPAVAAVGC